MHRKRDGFSLRNPNFVQVKRMKNKAMLLNCSLLAIELDKNICLIDYKTES